jgi:hypothetical protein
LRKSVLPTRRRIGERRLQSNNEELQTTKKNPGFDEEPSHECRGSGRNVQLGSVNDDLVNLLAAISTPIVMVGNDLCIRRFTPAARDSSTQTRRSWPPSVRF